MEKQQTIYITGHQNPDSDSIMSSVAYAYLKKKLGINAKASCLGDLNEESKYLLNRWNFEFPERLYDARCQLDEIELDEATTILPTTSIKEVVEMMNKNKKPAFAVTNEKKELLGIVTQSNISNIVLGDTAKAIQLLQETSLQCICDSINGELVNKQNVKRHNGKTSIVAIASSRLSNYELENRIVIVGDDEQAQLDAIEKKAAILIVVWTKKISDKVISLAKEYDCGVIISKHGSMNTSRYLFYAPPIEKIMTTNLVLFNKAEFVEDAMSKVMRSRYRFYPVVDDENKIYGFVSRYHLLNANRKKIILVDHNEPSQSVPNLKQGEIVEIVDHHRIGAVSTDKPITFRNETVGSTATIITKLFYENNIEIHKNIAGILLGAMISDTLNFKSPTTTIVDQEIARQLAFKAKVDISEYAKDIFSVASSISKVSIKDILYYDMKQFTINHKKVFISQYILYKFTGINDLKERLLKELNRFKKQEGADLWLMVFTSVHDNGSILYYSDCDFEELICEAFSLSSQDPHTFIPKLVSRKNQIIPKLTLALNTRSFN